MSIFSLLNKENPLLAGGAAQMKGTAFWLWVLACGLLSAWLIPVSDPFPYSYAPGSVWRSGDLYAPYTFDVLKSPSDTIGSSAKTKAATEVYYQCQLEVNQQQKRNFTTLLQEQTKLGQQDARYVDLISNTNAYLSYGLRMLDALYIKGILSERPAQPQPIVVATRNVYRHTHTDSLFTIDRARTYLSDSLPFSPLREPELILPILNQCVAANVFYSDSLTRVHNMDAIQKQTKTGESIQRGTKIVLKGEQVSPLVAQRLYSLAATYPRPVYWMIRTGYFLFASLVFLLSFAWIRANSSADWDVPRKRTQMAGIVLLVLALIRVLHAVSPMLVFVVPLYLLPLLLHRWFSERISFLLWSLSVVLLALCKDWGFGWCCMQAGAVWLALQISPKVVSWSDRALAIAIIVLFQGIIWGVLFLSGQLSMSMESWDVPVFLALGGLLSLAQSLIARFWGFRAN